MGEGMRSDHMVWRHTCSIIDFKAILTVANVVSIIMLISSKKNLTMFEVTLHNRLFSKKTTMMM